ESSPHAPRAVAIPNGTQDGDPVSRGDTLMTPTFTYKTVRLKDLHVVTIKNNAGRTVVASVNLHDEPLVPTDRFWHSLHTRFGFTGNIFRYFSHAEVFTRISEVAGDDQLRLCIESAGDPAHPGQLL